MTTNQVIEEVRWYEDAALSYVYLEYGGNYTKTKFHGRFINCGTFIKVICECGTPPDGRIIELKRVQMWTVTKEIVDLYVGLCRHGVVHYAIYSGGGEMVAPPPADKSS